MPPRFDILASLLQDPSLVTTGPGFPEPSDEEARRIRLAGGVKTPTVSNFARELAMPMNSDAPPPVPEVSQEEADKIRKMGGMTPSGIQGSAPPPAPAAQNVSTLPNPKYGFDLNAELSRLGPAPTQRHVQRPGRGKFQWLAEALGGLGDVATAYGGGRSDWMGRVQQMGRQRQDDDFRDQLMQAAMDYERNKAAYDQRFREMGLRQSEAVADYGRQVGDRNFQYQLGRDTENTRRYEGETAERKRHTGVMEGYAKSGQDLTKQKFEFEKSEAEKNRKTQDELLAEMKAQRTGTGKTAAALIDPNMSLDDAEKMAQMAKAQINERQDLTTDQKMEAFREIDTKLAKIRQKNKESTTLSWLTGGVRSLFGMPTLDEQARKDFLSEQSMLNKRGDLTIQAIKKYAAGEALSDLEAQLLNEHFEKTMKNPTRVQGSNTVR